MYRIQLLLATLFSLTASADHHVNDFANACYMHYPNIEGKTVLENDHVVVQRFTIQPGQWEGIHRHPPHQIYIQLTDGDWSYKTKDAVDNFSLNAGAVSWNEASTEMDIQHESGNSGDKPISYIWVGVKPGCLTEPE